MISFGSILLKDDQRTIACGMAILIGDGGQVGAFNGDGEDGKAADGMRKLIRILQDEEKMDDDWEYFAVHFDKVHSDFLVALKEHYPNLTANELKLSAYLRMNLSTKEVAQLMNISVRGVEISRYRLRKKLGIPAEVNLFHYLMNFNGSNGHQQPAEMNRSEPVERVLDGE